MLDIKFIREHADEVKQNLVNRHNPFDLDKVLELDGKRRELLQETEALKSEKNAESKKIAQAKKNGEDASDAIASMREVGRKISAIDKELGEVEGTLNELLLHIPNMADKTVPVGKDDSENPEVRKWGEIPTFDFPIKAHYELGDTLGILDAERAGTAQTSIEGNPNLWTGIEADIENRSSGRVAGNGVFGVERDSTVYNQHLWCRRGGRLVGGIEF